MEAGALPNGKSMGLASTGTEPVRISSPILSPLQYNHADRLQLRQNILFLRRYTRRSRRN